MIVEAIHKVIKGENLDFEAAKVVMGEMMDGTATHAQMGAFLTALRIKSAIPLAQDLIDSGAANNKLEDFVKLSNEVKP